MSAFDSRHELSPSTDSRELRTQGLWGAAMAAGVVLAAILAVAAAVTVWRWLF